jgi:glycosyltransferase involved in cell wall biosynthesis
VGDARLTKAAIPPEVEAAARRRSEARADRDWATADRLRGEIEDAGWRVVDKGDHFRLEPASPPSVEVAGEIRYGRSEDVPSLLGQPETGLASVVVVASGDPDETRRCIEALAAHAPAGVDVVVVLDGVDGSPPPGDSTVPVEAIRTSAPLGRGAALNIGIRRSRAPVVVVLDPATLPAGDVISPLVEALGDPGIAVAGPFGLVSSDLRRFETVGGGVKPLDAAAIQGSAMAFRRRDAAARGPIDEAFRSPNHLDVWWSLVLRDEGEGEPARRALAVPGLALERGDPTAPATSAAGKQDRRAKRNFYRVLDRFRARLDLAVPPDVV